MALKRYCKILCLGAYSFCIRNASLIFFLGKAVTRFALMRPYADNFGFKPSCGVEHLREKLGVAFSYSVIGAVFGNLHSERLGQLSDNVCLGLVSVRHVNVSAPFYSVKSRLACGNDDFLGRMLSEGYGYYTRFVCHFRILTFRRTSCSRSCRPSSAYRGELF